MGSSSDTVVSVGFSGMIEKLADSFGWDLVEANEELESLLKDLDLVSSVVLYDLRCGIEMFDEYIVGAERFTRRNVSSIDFTVADLTEAEVEQLNIAATRLGVTISSLEVVVGTQDGF